MISVQFQNVSKAFGSNLVVKDLSLEVNPGELFFLLGPSGCGKTTCLRMVAGFLTPDGGAISFGERAMNRVPPHKRNAGMVFQNYALWPHLSVKGNVEYGLKVRKIAREERERRTREALEMVRLDKFADRYPNQLSGGQQQRVALARALVVRPDVLLLDEPLSNLDAQLRLEMRREIKRLHQATGVTAIYVTHDQNEALSIADRVAVMQNGQVEQVGAPREIYRVPRTRFVAEFLGETNFIAGTLKSFDARAMQIETAVGVLRAARQDEQSWREGQSVWCSIRPETLRLDKQAPNDALNFLPAEIESATYLGETEQLVACLSSGLEKQNATQGDEDWRRMKVSILNPRQPVRIGESCVLSCAPEDVVVLAR